MNSERNLQIQDLRNGGVLELLNNEINKVTDDIADPNKEAKEKRTISLTLEFAPNEDARMGTVKATVASKLGKQKAVTASLFFGYDNGKGIASERIIPTLPIGDAIEAGGDDN
jgi:hypothetical protein